MNWYYADGNQQKGPISEAELDQLFQQSQITSSTLIWKEGMASWAPYSNVRGNSAAAGGADLSAGGVVCSQCSQIFNENDIIRYGDKAICASCKPVFLQKLREGSSLSPSDLDYASFGIRFGAKFLDNIIVRIVTGAVGFGIGMAMGAAGGEDAAAVAGLIGGVVAFLMEVAYRIFFVGAYGATPGKMACKIRIVNSDGSKLSYAKATGRAFAEYLSMLTCLIGYIMAGFDNERRSLHDRICDTRVIRN